ncbi:uncharacterized protein NPIL_331381 [Nephila pilipes]|uniref:Uncharacterized protein n=1 Tax=Nephila pilipes TaxID=299642 RepID=A0A8X6NK87_NEPPI|nr:uncharacterized protein NPIL_331381 [Nephila pilipes]
MVSNTCLKQKVVFFCIFLKLTAFAYTGKDMNGAFTINKRIGRSGHFDKFNERTPYILDSKIRNYESSTHPITLSELDDSNSDVNVEDKYSYSPGGFYIPREMKDKINYSVEEIIDKQNQNRGFLSDEELPENMEAKESKVLVSSERIGTQIAQRPSFMSTFRKLMLNPIVLTAITMVPLAFFAETIFPQLLKMFGNNMVPKVSSTIANGFARSLNGNASIQVESILDVINEYGARAIEDPKCFKKFICQGVKSRIESRSGDSWSIEKVVQTVTNSVDEGLLDRFGLKRLIHSIENHDCDSLECTGSTAYTHDMPLMKKIYLLGSKFLNQTEILH